MEQEIRFCRTTDGSNIAYATVGQGPPLVKVANWLSHLEFEWQSPVWRHWLRELAAQHQLIRYDERGCGLSDWDVTAFSLDAWLADLEAVVAAAGLERFPLFGLSRGGPVAVAYAARHPQQVSALVLYGAYARGWQHREISAAKQKELEVLYDLIRVGWGQSNPAFRQVFTSLFMPDANAEQVRWFNDLQRISTSPENAVKMRAASGAVDVRELATQLKTPTLVLHARGDAMVPFNEGRLLATLIPGARFVSLESNNHILLEDEPAWSLFVREVRGFLGLEGEPAAQPYLRATEQSSAAAPAELTLRERDVLELLARGYRNEDIAQRLVLSPKTVRNYISNIFDKLAANTRGEAIVKARELGFGREE
jgi:pimeloyl-ACP methyl ester carboxylesterase/DNA-binding CsgD family transcriptional regulator